MTIFAKMFSFLGCSGVYTAANGTVMSPNYPNNYPNSRVCKSKIRVAIGFRVQLNFSEIDVESHGTCSFDSLSIYNGPDETAPLLGRYCDRHAASTLTSSSNEVLIVFKSDISNTGRGFKAMYNSISGGKSLHFFHVVMTYRFCEAVILNEESRLDVVMSETQNRAIQERDRPTYSLLLSFFIKKCNDFSCCNTTSYVYHLLLPYILLKSFVKNGRECHLKLNWDRPAKNNRKKMKRILLLSNELFTSY